MQTIEITHKPVRRQRQLARIPTPIAAGALPPSPDIASAPSADSAASLNLRPSAPSADSPASPSPEPPAVLGPSCDPVNPSPECPPPCSAEPCPPPPHLRPSASPADNSAAASPLASGQPGSGRLGVPASSAPHLRPSASSADNSASASASASPSSSAVSLRNDFPWGNDVPTALELAISQILGVLESINLDALHVRSVTDLNYATQTLVRLSEAAMKFERHHLDLAAERSCRALGSGPRGLSPETLAIIERELNLL